jgi:hypothetical protein
MLRMVVRILTFYIVMASIIMYLRVFTAQEFNTFNNLFISSIYFVVASYATVGYGDITTQSTKGQLVIIFVNTLGFIFFTYFLSKMRIVFSTLQDKYSNLVMEEVSEMNLWLIVREKYATSGEDARYHKRFGLMEKFVKTYHSYILHDVQGQLFQSRFFSELPYNDQQQILESGFQGFSSLFSYLAKCLSEPTLRSIYTKFKTKIFLKQEVVLTQGQKSTGLYFIFGGEIGLYHKKHPDIRLITLSTGSFIGDNWLLKEDEHFDFV